MHRIFTWRFYFIVVLLGLILLGLMIRMDFLGVIHRNFLLRQSNMRSIRVVDIPAYRGMITDRNGIPLAISSPVQSIWINPHLFSPTPQQMAALSKLADVLTSTMLKKMKKNQEKFFVYLRRDLVPSNALKIKALEIPGLFFQQEYKRYYPESDEIAQVIGFTNIDDNGQEGLELAFNQWLQGIPGKKKVVKDRLGHLVADLGVVREPKEGQDLVLSIDSRIQYLAYTVLRKTVEDHHGQSGSVVALDPATGEILAMANVPSYNPNRRLKDRDGRYRNRAVTDVFEPGSTMKVFSVANALASGKYKPDTVINTGPGWMVIKGHTINDDANYGKLTVSQIVQKSSNIGVAKMTLSLPPENLWKLLHQIGFGERTASGFPGESSGVLIKRRLWRPTDLATLAFGYGISVTALQLAKGYAVIANNGKNVPITFLKRQKKIKGREVMSPEIAHEMMSIMMTVVEKKGTGKAARVKGYQVAGKTGTAYVVGPNGYEKDHYTASFVGIAPVKHPKIVLAVVIHNVSAKDHFGGQVAAPAFAQIMTAALNYLNIPPDNS